MVHVYIWENILWRTFEVYTGTNRLFFLYIYIYTYMNLYVNIKKERNIFQKKKDGGIMIVIKN